MLTTGWITKMVKRQNQDLKVPGSIPNHDIHFNFSMKITTKIITVSSILSLEKISNNQGGRKFFMPGLER